MKNKTFSALLGKYGLKTIEEEIDDLCRPAQVFAVQRPDFGGSFNGRQFAADTDPFAEIGLPGVPISGGQVQAEPNAKYSPYIVRGYTGIGSLYERYYRAEPVLFEGINEGNNLLVSGHVEFLCPDVPLSQRSAAEEATAFVNGWFKRMWRGPSYFLRHLGAAKIFGFYAHEIVWANDHKGRWHPKKLAPREPSTIDSWITDNRGDLLGAKFQVMPPTSDPLPGMENEEELDSSYTLSSGGSDIRHYKLLISNIHARANNFEGISLVRPALHWVKLKQLLSQILAVTGQKYGVPVPVVQARMIQGDEAYAPAQIDMQAALEAVTSIESADGAALVMPPDVQVHLLAAQGTMPQLERWLEYCDSMIERPLAAEAAGLGQQTVGSYALAEVLDNRMLRAQPGFFDDVAQALNWLVRDVLDAAGYRLDDYPTAFWSMPGFDDASRWISDATTAMGGAPMWEWPREMQQEALRKLGLPPTTFDDFEEPDLPSPSLFRGVQFSASKRYDHIDFTASEGAREAAQQGLDYRREYGRGGTETGIARARDIARGANLSPDTVRRMAAFFSRHEKNRDSESRESDGGPTNGWIAWLLWGGDAGRSWADARIEQMDAADNKEMSAPCGCGDCGCGACPYEDWLTLLRADRTAPATQFASEPTSTLGGAMNGDRVEGHMNAAERRIAAAISPIVTEMQTAWRQLVRDGLLDPVAIEDRLREVYRPRLETAIFQESTRLQRQATGEVFRELGHRVEPDMVPVSARHAAAIRASAHSAAAEVFSRQYGYMLDAAADGLQADIPEGVPRLKTTTLSTIAAGVVTRAYAVGRDEAVELIQDSVSDLPPARAYRTSMLDNNVCERCRALDFEHGGPVHLVGSSAYFDDMPPRHCEGGDRCRCAYVYEISGEYDEAIGGLIAGWSGGTA